MSDKFDALPIVLVQLGQIPNHLKRNLEYLSLTFPTKDRYLITDSKDWKWIQDLGFQVISSETLLSSWPEKFQVIDRRKYFRNNFWFSTKARLILLPEFMKKFELNRILHIESDVWIHPDFPFEFFVGIKNPLAYPKMDEDRGIASILLINGEDGADLLERCCLEWPNHTDMEILGKAISAGYDIYELPSTTKFNSNTESNWIFDGAKLGMYLFGADPMNSKGVIRRFSASPLGQLAPDERITLTGNRFLLEANNSDKRIANLHLHSKNSKMFRLEWATVLKRQLVLESIHAKYSFSVVAWFKSMIELSQRAGRKVRRMAQHSGT